MVLQLHIFQEGCKSHNCHASSSNSHRYALALLLSGPYQLLYRTYLDRKCYRFPYHRFLGFSESAALGY
jgi:hypothetical protein